MNSFLLSLTTWVLGVACLTPVTVLGAEPHPLWELGAGVGVLTVPDYRGSDEQRAYLFPIPYFVYRGEVLQIDREKIRGLLFKTERLELDFSLSGSFPVKSDDNKARAGMPDLDPTAELGPQLNVLLSQGDKYKLTLQLPVRQVLAVSTSFDRVSNAGLIFNPILNLDVKDFGLGEGWNLGLSGGPLWADSEYHQYFYGVRDVFATPQRPAYKASGGYSGSQITLSLSKRFPKTWAGAFVRVYDLHGTAFEDSPLVKRKVSVMAGFGMSWIISQSGKIVMADD